MAFLNTNVLDSGLSWAKSNADKIYICSAEPATYTAATSTNALGNKNFGGGAVFPGAIAAGSPSGRKITTAPVTDGSVTGNGTATHWAIVYSGGSALVAASSLAASQSVVSGNSFTLTGFDIRLPGTGG
jgi:hypothetical protein